MLQRSPTYIVAHPSEDAAGNRLRQWLPERLALRMIRWKNVLLGMYFYNLSRRKPERVKQEILRLVREQLGPDFDVQKHFTPRYNPWDQRLCLVPDADLFVAIRSGKAAVVTDEIDTFTETGIQLRSGDLLQADIIVTATGLKLKCLGGDAGNDRRHSDQYGGKIELQRNDVPRHPEPFVHTRLHQRVVDAQVQSGCRIYLPTYSIICAFMATIVPRRLGVSQPLWTSHRST